MLTDYHIHLRPDEPDTPAERFFTPENVGRYLEAAQGAGVSELGVSEHIHRFRRALEVWDHPFWIEQATDDIEAYCTFVRSTPLRLGLEVDYVPGAEYRTSELIGSLDLDYVIGSVHFIGDRAVDHPGFDIWESDGDADRVWQRYFETLAEAASSGLFDVIAHPDLVKVWGSARPGPRQDPRFHYEPFVAAASAAGVAVEVSTAGLRKPVGELYPAPALLEMLVEAGCPLALSSDAHVPEHVGHRYGDALEELEAAGVSQIATFDRRTRRMEPLG